MRTDYIRLGLSKVLHFALSCMVCIFLNGCTDDGALPAPDTPKQLSGNFTLRLTLTIDGSNGTARSAVPSRAGDPERPGTSSGQVFENRINRLNLFFVNAATGERKHTAVIPPKVADGTGTVVIELPIEGDELGLTDKTTYTVYVGANLSDDQTDCFLQGNDRAYSVPQRYLDLGYGLTEAYAPGGGIGLQAGFAGESNGYTRKDIAMFCTEPLQVTVDSSSDVFVPEGTFQLERNVAKVLVTCETASSTVAGNADGYEPGVDYCLFSPNADEDLRYPNNYDVAELQGKPRGWIRRQDVKFLINAVNKKSFLMQQWSSNELNNPSHVIDPNQSYGGEGSIYTIQASDGTPQPVTYDDDFCYTAIQDLHYVYTYYVPTLSYEPSRVPRYGQSNTSGTYYEGMYCPENTYEVSGITDSEYHVLLNYRYPWAMMTHVAIAVKFTPRELYVEEDITGNPLDNYTDAGVTEADKETARRLVQEAIDDGQFVTYSFTMDGTTVNKRIVRVNAPDERVASLLLNASIAGNYQLLPADTPYEPESPGLPEGTYYSIFDSDITGKTCFFTYGAAQYIARAEDIRESDTQFGSFRTMRYGRGYFFTYIDNRSDDDADKLAGTDLTYEDASVERNKYYILTVGTFSSPGNIGGKPYYLKVHTSTVAWQGGGDAGIVLQ